MRIREVCAVFAGIVFFWGLGRTAPRTDLPDGEAVLRAMHEHYAKDWYDTLTFEQKSITHQGDSAEKIEIWHEALKLPGKLRIDIGQRDAGNGMLVADGTLTRFQNHEVTTSRPFVHMLLVLGFDVYRQTPETTIVQIKGEDFDLAKIHEDTWDGKPVYVVGADKGDLKTKQFWIDKESLLFVRLIEPDSKEPAKINDTRFEDYRRLSVGWVAARVEFYVDGHLVFSEIYSDVKVNPKLDSSLFDAKRFQHQPAKAPAPGTSNVQPEPRKDLRLKDTFLETCSRSR